MTPEAAPRWPDSPGLGRNRKHDGGPQTAAGRALLAVLHAKDLVRLNGPAADAILAIEAEAAAGTVLNVERFIAAMAQSPISSMSFENVRVHLPAIAAEYARLAGVEKPKL